MEGEIHHLVFFLEPADGGHHHRPPAAEPIERRPHLRMDQRMLQRQDGDVGGKLDPAGDAGDKPQRRGGLRKMVAGQVDLRCRNAEMLRHQDLGKTEFFRQPQPARLVRRLQRPFPLRRVHRLDVIAVRKVDVELHGALPRW